MVSSLIRLMSSFIGTLLVRGSVVQAVRRRDALASGAMSDLGACESGLRPKSEAAKSSPGVCDQRRLVTKGGGGSGGRM